jgi:hypothetical protein
MRAFVTINGLVIGDFEFELPRDERGRTQALLPKELWDRESGCEIEVGITDGDGNAWGARGKVQRV